MKSENSDFGQEGQYGEGFDQLFASIEQYLQGMGLDQNKTLGNDGPER